MARASKECITKARSAFDFGASTPAGEKRGSLINVPLSEPSQWIEYGGFETIASNLSSSKCFGSIKVSPFEYQIYHNQYHVKTY